MRTWNWYDGSHDDIAGREEEMMEIEVVVITESGEDMIWKCDDGGGGNGESVAVEV